MAKGDRKSNREVRKPKKEVSKTAASPPPSYLTSVIGKTGKSGAKPKK